MIIIADSNIPLLDETFGQHGRIIRVDGRTISRTDLISANVLLIRSVTHVDATLLEDTAIKFVGSATIGTDHLDIKWLDKSGIHWANAPGCNANAAAQYTLAMMALCCERLGCSLFDQSIGIIGRGNVGTRLINLLEVLGISTVAHDPPLSQAGVKRLVGFEQVLDQDIVSLHVPLTRTSTFPSYRMINAHTMDLMRNGTILLNTSRGDVIDEAALAARIRAGRIHAALDVWQDEPAVNASTINACTVASPHVAGYSIDGKNNGTLMIYEAFANWAGINHHNVSTDDDPRMEAQFNGDTDPLPQLLRLCCDVETDDHTMRELAQLPQKDRAAAFDKARESYRLRRDFGAWRVCGVSTGSRVMLDRLGFQ
jgi:erythronate-4-phosphate dehydrogenase